MEIKQIKKNQQIYYKIAGKFSAKEAVVKAMGTGFSDGIKIKDIEILNRRNKNKRYLLTMENQFSIYAVKLRK